MIRAFRLNVEINGTVVRRTLGADTVEAAIAGLTTVYPGAKFVSVDGGPAHFADAPELSRHPRMPDGDTGELSDQRTHIQKPLGGTAVEMTEQEKKDRHRRLIEERLRSDGLHPDEWRNDEDGQIEAVLGKWRVTDEDEDKGLYEGEEGTLTASVVGAPEHGNEQVKYHICLEDQEVGIECRPFENVEAADR